MPNAVLTDFSVTSVPTVNPTFEAANLFNTGFTNAGFTLVDSYNLAGAEYRIYSYSTGLSPQVNFLEALFTNAGGANTQMALRIWESFDTGTNVGTNGSAANFTIVPNVSAGATSLLLRSISHPEFKGVNIYSGGAYIGHASVITPAIVPDDWLGVFPYSALLYIPSTALNLTIRFTANNSGNLPVASTFQQLGSWNQLNARTGRPNLVKGGLLWNATGQLFGSCTADLAVANGGTANPLYSTDQTVTYTTVVNTTGASIMIKTA